MPNKKEKPKKAVSTKPKVKKQTKKRTPTKKKKKPSYQFKFNWEGKEYSLTNKQRMFCEYYFKSNNGNKAAIAAGYSVKSARELASKTLTKTNIKAYNAFLLDQNGFNIEAVFKEHLKLMSQDEDKTNKKGSIDMYYKLKGTYAVEKKETTTVIKFAELDDKQLDEAINAIE